MASSIRPTPPGSAIVVRQELRPVMVGSELSLRALVALADLLVSTGDMHALERVLRLIRARLTDGEASRLDS